MNASADLFTPQLSNWLASNSRNIPDSFYHLLQEHNITTAEQLLHAEDLCKTQEGTLKVLERKRFRHAVDDLRKQCAPASDNFNDGSAVSGEKRCESMSFESPQQKRQRPVSDEVASIVDATKSAFAKSDSNITDSDGEENLTSFTSSTSYIECESRSKMTVTQDLALEQEIIDRLNDLIYPDDINAEPSAAVKQRLENMKDAHIFRTLELTRKLENSSSVAESNVASSSAVLSTEIAVDTPVVKSKKKSLSWHPEVVEPHHRKSTDAHTLLYKRLQEKERLALLDAMRSSMNTTRWKCQQCGCSNSPSDQRCHSCFTAPPVPQKPPALYPMPVPAPVLATSPAPAPASVPKTISESVSAPTSESRSASTLSPRSTQEAALLQEGTTYSQNSRVADDNSNSENERLLDEDAQQSDEAELEYPVDFFSLMCCFAPL